jgi:guanylate kinase
MKGNLIIISSPSGGGKGTLIREVLDTVPAIGYSVSFTTRPARLGEVHGRDYNFITIEEFRQKIDRKEFLEYAEVHGNCYGTSLEATREKLETGVDVILEIDVQGALQVMDRIVDDVTSIFIMPPSFDVLRARLTSRNTENDADLALRLHNSSAEMAEFDNFDYVVINDEVLSASRKLAAIIVAERQKRVRQIDAIGVIMESFERSKDSTTGE